MKYNPAADPVIRRSGLGSSDAAAAMGRSRWKTKLTVSLEKRGEIPPPDLSDNEKVQFGILLEDVVAREWARRKGKKVRCVNRTMRHPVHRFLMAHPDREIVGESALLEVKTTDKYMSREWGPSDED
jgi:putative phage-type endonuclease